MVDSLILGIRTWSLLFDPLKYLDYMQDYMMLLEQSDHIVFKALATVT